VTDDAEAGFREFALSRSAGLYRLAVLLVADPGGAEDILQVTLVRTWRAWAKVARADNPDAYVRKIMVNAAVSMWRRPRSVEMPTATVPDKAAPSAVETVDDRLLLISAVRSLPPRQRAAVVLRYFCDLDDEAIGAILGCTISTVRSQISRALGHLRVEGETNPTASIAESHREPR
jgi:RNA polymerase sigma-70 factor (sigma-E family)